MLERMKNGEFVEDEKAFVSLVIYVLSMGELNII